MALRSSLMTFFSVGRNLTGFQIKLKPSNSRDGIRFLPKPFFE